MTVIRYGVWEGEVIDNRDRRRFEIADVPGFEDFDEFDPGNSVLAFFGGKGFFVFDESADMLEAVQKHIARAAEESCGKCTPCRVGLQVLSQKLMELRQYPKKGKMLDDIQLLADQIKETSLCGLGQTAPVALAALLKHFSDEVLASTSRPSGQGAATYVTAPCIEACPAKVRIPKYIDYIKEGKFTHSVGVVLQKYPMAATCGRVCVRFCELECRRTQVDEAVGIKVLKRFVADKERYVTDSWFSKDLIAAKKPDDLKVAVIGTGPAGISVAYHMLLRGYPVDVFEAMTEPGGMAAVGIPEYRLPKKEILHKEISIIETLGGTITYNQRMGHDFTLQDLKDRGYHAIFLGLGAHRGKTLGIPGEDRSVEGYITGVKFLLYINHYFIDIGLPVDLGEVMVVVGGGNVAMDCARSALRMGVKEVHLVYRRTKSEMPADVEEVEAAEREGVIFHFLSHPTRILHEDGKVTGVELIEMEIGEADASGRRGVHPKEGSAHVLETNFIVPAIGQGVDHTFLTGSETLELDKWGLIPVDGSTMMTDIKGVFAGGDCVSGPATLIEAMSQGERAAEAMDDYLTYGKVKFNPERRMSKLLEGIKKINADGVDVPVQHMYRVEIPELDPEVRKRIFEEVEKPISKEEAIREAERCMRCYRVYSVVTDK
ncbi:MAG: FAD-dependent oxidoreductase [Deltaproteobacteria bacterium]|nr:FAD-dependent oxidoreductase [Deltaproteobacteria bacterium]MBN2671545.1 FAD-dependent oxidoreductase [Deltaproteobacteria bacterium]